MSIQQGSNLPRVKKSNLVAIRKMIYHYGPITRAEISHQLNLTLPTITTNVSQMLGQGFLMEVAQSENKLMGRPAIPVDITPNAAYFIGVEMRGSRRQLSITDLRGNVLYADSSESHCRDYNAALDSACGLICNALDSGVVPRNKIAGLGFCTPGIVDNDSGTLVVHPGYNWINQPLREDIIRRTGFDGPILIDNNARARANGALMFMQDKTRDRGSFAYLMISAGIACPFVLNNGVVSSVALGAGEVGHMVLDPLGPKCNCGNKGCLEAYSSDDAVIYACWNNLRSGDAPILSQICDGSHPNMDQILLAQERGDPAVTSVLRRAVYFIGVAIANIYNFIAPEVLLVEGKLFENQSNREYMLEVVETNLYSTITDANFLFVSPDPDRGAVGAAAGSINHYLENHDF